MPTVPVLGAAVPDVDDPAFWSFKDAVGRAEQAFLALPQGEVKLRRTYNIDSLSLSSLVANTSLVGSA